MIESSSADEDSMEPLQNLILWASMLLTNPQECCRAKFLWGHGEDVTSLKRNIHLFDSHHTLAIAQGCKLGDINSEIPDAPGMWGINGDWSSNLDVWTANGGFNPKLNNSQITSQVQITVANAIGFMRLTKTNWWALLRALEKRLKAKDCQGKVQIEFVCLGDDMTNESFQSRLHHASDPRNYLKGMTANDERFFNHSCRVKDTKGEDLAYVPTKCGRVWNPIPPAITADQ